MHSQHTLGPLWVTICLGCVLFLVLFQTTAAEDADSLNTDGEDITAEALEQAPPPLSHWQDVVRQSPYWVSQGVHENLTTIRRWVLRNQSFCGNTDRHILFDSRATFLGYLDNADTREETQERINQRRAGLAVGGHVESWLPGGSGETGYPFALNCDQPDARLSESLARYTGDDDSTRLWGTWDGMRVGSEDEPVSLHEAIRIVYDDRVEQGRISMPETVLSTLAGKTIIESGGLKDAYSVTGARGVMQLSADALSDCELAERFYYHRLAQVDCALRLLEQNHRNLEPIVSDTFTDLPADKFDALYSMLLIQAYHGGVSRVSALMTDDDYNGAAHYFARHHDRFTAGDMALGMVFHNLGRNQLGFASLYYVTDVAIATRAACETLDDLAGCDEQ